MPTVGATLDHLTQTDYIWPYINFWLPGYMICVKYIKSTLVGLKILDAENNWRWLIVCNVGRL